MPPLDINQIRQILPHRYPMLLVDRILELDATHCVGIKNISINEPCFDGHFPGFPVMPGVLVLSGIPDRDSKLVFLASVDNARFRKPVLPGDQLRLEITILKSKASVAKIAARATVDGVLVAEADLMCALQDKAAAIRV